MNFNLFKKCITFIGTFSIMIFMISGCSPQYATVSKVSKPQSQNQGECARNCDRVSNICTNMCKKNEARCFDLQKYSTRGGYHYNPNDYFNSSHFYNCDFVLDSCIRDCNENNLLCYSNCGLTISAETICIENCDE